ncbi:MAG: hypothetical protein COU64_04115 [Candidatus Pacebacteria bacterium CG10_big_fil_rev_8_21_14_0_10_40_26]|nr:MAG: hypothetical protein COU64_04115 [Candidatus Pacebacteria bacterium CG10_big_fil_rev_8_21_14_0_10_40_26]
MLRCTNMFELIFLAIIYLFVLAKPAQAYLDPGIGSYITQLIIGFSVGGGYLIKVYFKQIASFFKDLMKKNKQK